MKLRKEDESDDGEGKKKNGNGNGSHSNGNGNGNGGLMGSLMVEAEAVSLKRGVLNTKNQSIVIIQKDSLSEHTVGVEKK